jgi:hypothetical protein
MRYATIVFRMRATILKYRACSTTVATKVALTAADIVTAMISTSCWRSSPDDTTGSSICRQMMCFSGPNLSSRTIALGSTQSLTEMSTTNLPGGKGRPAGA